jgi:hypothetical protein
MSTPLSPTASGPAAPQKTVTIAEFLQEWPLYRALKFTNWSAPPTLSLDCRTCGKETSWGRAQGDFSQLSSYFLYLYTCHLCGKSNVTYLLNMNSNTAIKVGQFPAPSANIPNQIEKRLGASAIFYRRALTSRNQGYGLGAVAYLRRVIENKTHD